MTDTLDILIFTEGDLEDPQWWANFRAAEIQRYYDIDKINEILRKYNAVFYTTKPASAFYGERRLKFRTAADLSHFMLRWS